MSAAAPPFALADAVRRCVSARPPRLADRASVVPARARSRVSRPRHRLVVASALHGERVGSEGFAPRVRSRETLELATITRDDEPNATNHSKAAFVSSLSVFATTAGLHPIDSFARAAVSSAPSIDPFFNFNPVCPASDGVFRVGQRAALGLAGADNIENYRPLINDVLIRVRTELCVLESFLQETALPFIREKGVGWVLPLHETSETYLAGVVFMVGANFILLGSTKVVAILAIYHDLSVGLICRGLGGLLGMATPEADKETREREFGVLAENQTKEMKAVMMDSSLDKSTREAKTNEIMARYSSLMEESKSAADLRFESNANSPLASARILAGGVSVPLKLYGRASGMLRNGLEVFDTFCSRYFVAFTVTYIIVKTTHYVLFPNIFD